MFKQTAAGSLVAIAVVFPCYGWEESDKNAFEEKIEIISTLITEQIKEMGKEDKKVSEGIRTQCLLQSIGIDVVHHYLEMNPGDRKWKEKFSELRDSMTLCLAVMYNTPKNR